MAGERSWLLAQVIVWWRCLSRSPVSSWHSLAQLQGSPASVGQPMNVDTWAHTSTVGNIDTLQTGRQLSRRSLCAWNRSLPA